MDILQTIWTAMTTQNELLVKILLIPLSYLDAFVVMLFFTSILNINSNIKNKLLYVLIYGSIGTIITFLVPVSYAVYINIVIWPLVIFFVLKTSILKALLAEIISMVTTSILDFIAANILLTFSITSEMIMTIPLYRIGVMLSIYLILFILSKIITTLKINFKVIDNMNLKTKVLLILNCLLIILVLAMQFYLVRFYADTMPLFITIINIIGLIAYFGVSMYSIINSTKLQLTKQDLESANHSLHSLSILHDQVRSFKHDFDNIVNSIGGYVVTEDIDGLKKYYYELLEECNKTNNLYALSPKVINHPAIYHLLAI